MCVPDVSRMTIAVDCDESGIEQVEKQLNKLIPTIKVKVLEEGSYLSRELTMVKVSCNSRQREEIMTLAELMHARIIDVTSTSLTLELTDTTARTENFISLMRPFGIKELVRTGISAIELAERSKKKTPQLKRCALSLLTPYRKKGGGKENLILLRW